MARARRPNADEIGRASEYPNALPRSDILAARMMLRRIDELVRSHTDFVVETTLATRTYARKILDWQAHGYIVSLIYLRLRSIEDSIARVRKRVAAGGHGIPEATIRRRFGRSMRYFETVYKSTVDEWYVWDSREGDFVLADAWDRT